MPYTSPARFNFELVMTECHADASQVRAAAKDNQLDYHNLSDHDVLVLKGHFHIFPTAHALEAAADAESTPTNTEEPTMATTTPARQTARTREGDTTRTAKRAAAEGISAAQAARDAGVDARKFRAFLRAQGIDRTFARKGDATKALKAFAKASA